MAIPRRSRHAGNRRSRHAGSRRGPVVALAGLLAAILLTGCGTAAQGSRTQKIRDVSPYLAAAQARVDNDYRGTNRKPDPSPRPATKGKRIAILSLGQISISSRTPSNAALEAAQVLGWQAQVLDGQLNPKIIPGLMQSALNSGVDGIIVDAIDCPLIAPQLAQAKAKGVPVIPIYAFDCNDALFGGTGQNLFSGSVNYGPDAKDIGTFTLDYGADQADAVIAHTGGHARVIFFNDPQLSVLQYTAQGFKDELARCEDCKLVQEVDFHANELGPQLYAKAAAALKNHPEANAVKIPYTSAALGGIIDAVNKSGRSDDLFVVGGEGFEPEINLIRGNGGLDTVNIISSEWVGWAAADTLNSTFLGRQPVDSGIGWTLADLAHNVPKTGPYVPAVDFRAAYRQAWGVGPADPASG
jgi:ribose transport system substrate-binding protein